jgi:hypothetical protein
MQQKLFFLFLFAATQLQAQHKNIVLDNSGSADEPSICLDPKNPARIVAGTNIANIYYSSDTGKTWVKKIQQSTFGVYGDPVIACDNTGAFFHLHLSNPPDGGWIDRIVSQKSTDGGKTWNNGSYMGLNGSKNQDKHWVSIDRKTNVIYCTWTQFDKYESKIPSDSTHIMFSKSSDGGASWSAAKRINTYGGDCLDDDKTVEGAVPAVGTNGEVFVTWAGPNGLSFNCSLDGGATWLPVEKKIADIGGGWSYNVPGIMRCNGLPITVCDTSNGPNRGTIYVNWSDQKNGVSNTDIWLVKSKDGGKTWTSPIKVNNDNSNRQQFMTWMAVDQANGNLWFTFYDRRSYSNDSTDFYMALSKDGGETFKNFKVSEKPFYPNAGAFFGDYTNVAVFNNVVRPIWTAMNSDGRKTVYTALVNSDFLVSIGQNTEGPLLKDIAQINAFPNPTQDDLTITFEVNVAQKLCLYLYDASGKVVAKVFKKKMFGVGKFEEVVSLKTYNLPSGAYTYTLMNKKGKQLATNRFVKL